jgi:hypothetical protein
MYVPQLSPIQYEKKFHLLKDVKAVKQQEEIEKTHVQFRRSGLHTCQHVGGRDRVGI